MKSIKRTNEKLSLCFSSPKTLLPLLTLAIFISFLPMISGFEFDNVKDYDEETRTITITNAFGLGDEIAQLKLVSDPIVYVMPGENKKVAEIEFISFDGDYEAALRKMEFYDKNSNNNMFEREFIYKKKIQIGTTQKPVYRKECPTFLTVNGTGKRCNSVFDSYKQVPVYGWEEIKSIKEISNGGIVGIFTTVYEEDYVEWIPTFFGERIDEWATWQGSFNTNLLVYYMMNDTAGEGRNSVDPKGHNITLFAGNITRGSPGIINNSYLLNGTDGDYFESYDMTNLDVKTGTVAMWINWTSTEENNIANVWGLYDLDTSNERIQIYLDDRVGEDKLRLDSKFGGTVQYTLSTPQNYLDTFPRNTWVHITIVHNGSRPILYVNGTEVAGQVFDDDVNRTVWFKNLITNGVDVSSFGADRINNGTVSNFNGSVDEVGIWGRALSDTEISDLYNATGSGYSYTLLGIPGTMTVDLTSPTNGFSTLLTNISFNADLTPVNLNMTNATLYLYSSTGTLLNDTVTGIVIGNSTTNVTNLNLTNISAGNYNWNVLGCGLNDSSDVVCNFASNNFSFTIDRITIISSEWNNLTWQTKTETFRQNITIGSGTISSVKLIWNNTDKGGSFSSTGGQNYSMTTTFDIPLINSTVNWSWNVSFTDGAQESLNISTQQVGEINLTNCTVAPYDITFINFTFKNETVGQERTNSTISSTFNYWLGTGTINKTFTLSSAVEKPEYSFCLYPGHETINVNFNLDYNNAESQQRNYRVETGVLTNSTTNTVLYLLPTSLGVFQKFAVVDNNGDSISSVLGTISVVLGGNTVTTFIGLTDSSGFMSAFLNPDSTYSAVFSKTGLTSNSFTFVPTTETRTVVMGGTAAILGNGTRISGNTTYDIFPVNSSLNNGTTYTFGFNVSSSQAITLISMNITNMSGFQFLYRTNPGEGFISGTINTGENKTFIGKFVIQTADETISVGKIWSIGTIFIGDYSIYRQLKLFNDYGFKEFWKLLIVLSVIVGMLILLSGAELVETSESKLAVVVLLVWAFSVVGWLNTGLVIGGEVEPGIKALGEFSSQYGIAILTTAGGALFWIRKIF